MSDYNQIKTPGVYVEEKSVLPGSVSGVSTAVPAFIGYTEIAGVNGDLFGKPTKIRTLKDYEQLFGTRTETITVDATSNSIAVEIALPARLMYYSMQMFFDNGGESCYIVALNESETGKTELKKYQDAIDSLEFEDEPTLIVLVDAVNMATDDYYSLCKKVLTQCGKMKDRFALLDVKQDTTEDEIVTFRTNIGTENLKYGAAYYPYLQTSLKYRYNEALIDVTYYDTVLKANTTQKLSSTEVRDAQTELYNKIKDEIKKFSIILPPCVAVAGAYASVDRDRGVWKAPANVGLASVTGPTKKLTESENDGLNVDQDTGKSINAIRNFAGKGTLIWGARTLAGNDNEWRYVPVRRLFNYVEESIKKATSFAVFEPNNAMTWLKLRSMVESFLDDLWRQGALAGGKAEDAYFVQVGLGTTMTNADILEGRLIIKVGVAAVRPAEFIILEFTHKLQES